MSRSRCLGLLGALVVSLGLAIEAARAVLPDEMLPNPALESRARSLSRELRCMVCQNQSIDDSEAPLARDLRLLVRDRLKAGDNDRQVLEYLTARYGAFVLLKPPLEWATILLWFGPPGIVVIGAAALVVIARGRQAARRMGADAPRLSATEEARIAALLGQTIHEGGKRRRG
jgi:cytochrome c-type biogenesis protein CcmH